MSITRMAASVNNGCVSVSNQEIITKNGQNSVPNGIVKNGKHVPGNGFLKHNNSGTAKSNGVVSQNDKIIPPIDWSQHDFDPGSFEGAPFWTAVWTNIGFYILTIMGFINQLLFTPNTAVEKNREGYAPLYNAFEQFFSTNVYRRVRHCFNKPISSTPGAEVTVMERWTDDYNWTFRFTGTETRCINLGSYNYLGFADWDNPSVAEATRKYGLAMCSPRAELGTCPLHLELEEEMAKFLGVEAAIVFGMGFATNSLGLPGLLGAGDLILSDANNHASLIFGLRMAKVTVRVFRHNDVKHLEQLVRKAIAERKWKRIVVVIEGIYSMEGSIVPLPAIVALKKRYKLYIYLDEAHSIGALGPRGRGVTDYYGIDPNEIDILMGTYTKSFASAGGYIAGSSRVVRWIRAHCHASGYAHSMSPALAQQILAATRAICSSHGEQRLRNLRDNTRHFRERLHSMGVVVYGHRDSPVVPMLTYTFSKIVAVVERLAEKRVAVVGVGFPATPLNFSRIRFCLSASHTREQLDECLNAIEEVADELGLRYSRKH